MSDQKTCAQRIADIRDLYHCSELEAREIDAINTGRSDGDLHPPERDPDPFKGPFVEAARNAEPQSIEC